MPFDPRTLVDPAFFSRLESIELRARSIVAGTMHGLHRSPYLGMSVDPAGVTHVIWGEGSAVYVPGGTWFTHD